jgi:hypothetical protein
VSLRAQRTEWEICALTYQRNMDLFPWFLRVTRQRPSCSASIYLLANGLSDLFDRVDSDDGSCTSVLRGCVTSGAVHRTFYSRLDILASVDGPDRCSGVHNHHGTTSFGSSLTGSAAGETSPLRSKPVNDRYRLVTIKWFRRSPHALSVLIYLASVKK